MKWPFSRQRTDWTALLRQESWHCAECGADHHGVIDIACKAPDPWPHIRAYEPNDALSLDRDFLSEDLCVLTSHAASASAPNQYFVRAILEIPLRGMHRTFGFGCWGAVSQENFEIWRSIRGTDQVDGHGPWWSWLSNALHPYAMDTRLGCWMHLRPGRKRPRLVVEDAHHPLAVVQSVGISPEELFETYRHFGHAPQLSA